jgi:protein-disulfide isomerase
LPSDGSEITIHLRRSHLWVAAALLIGGIAIGFLIGRVTADESQPVLYGLPATQGDGAAAETPAAGPVKVDTSGSPAQGPTDAKVTMVEFVDFECPFCGRFARDTLPRLRREYGDRIRYVSRQFPLDIHPDAPGAARAAVCAQEQGRYWKLHDLLFAHQEALGKRDLARYAREAGLDMGRYASCVGSAAARAVVEHDLADGRSYGVTGTPAFFINGRLISGAQPYSQFKAALDAALKG